MIHSGSPSSRMASASRAGSVGAHAMVGGGISEKKGRARGKGVRERRGAAKVSTNRLTERCAQSKGGGSPPYYGPRGVESAAGRENVGGVRGERGKAPQSTGPPGPRKALHNKWWTARSGKRRRVVRPPRRKRVLAEVVPARGVLTRRRILWEVGRGRALRRPNLEGTGRREKVTGGGPPSAIRGEGGSGDGEGQVTAPGSGIERQDGITQDHWEKAVEGDGGERVLEEEARRTPKVLGGGWGAGLSGAAPQDDP